MLEDGHVVFILLVRGGLIEKVRSTDTQAEETVRGRTPRNMLVSSWTRKDASVTTLVLARRRAV